jgi:hypothetical protein
MFFETPKTLAHSAYTPANPLRGKNYSARRKQKPSQAKPLRIPSAYPLPGSVRGSMCLSPYFLALKKVSLTPAGTVTRPTEHWSFP